MVAQAIIPPEGCCMTLANECLSDVPFKKSKIVLQIETQLNSITLFFKIVHFS